MLARRGFLVGLLATPSIVSAASIMRVAPYSIIWGIWPIAILDSLVRLREQKGERVFLREVDRMVRNK